MHHITRWLSPSLIVAMGAMLAAPTAAVTLAAASASAQSPAPVVASATSNATEGMKHVNTSANNDGVMLALWNWRKQICCDG